MIIVFGSLNIDLVLPVENFPVPGETSFCDDYVWLAGGKGMNQAVAAARAGSDVMMVGKVGEDAFADTLLAQLKNENIEIAHVLRSKRATGCATVMVDQKGENQILVAKGANDDVKETQLDDLNINVDTLCVLQMEIPITAIEKGIRALKHRGARVMLNVAPSRPFDYSICEHIDVLVLNEVEANDMATRLGLGANLNEEKIAQSISQKFNLSCVITLGPEGSVAHTVSGKLVRVPAARLGEVLDTTGAGDCYCGVLAASLDQGFSFEDAMQRASVAGGLAVLSRGAQTGMPHKQIIDEKFKATSLKYA